MAINPRDYKTYQGRTIDDEILEGLVDVLPYTDEQIEGSRRANNVPDNYVTIRTTTGGFVFVAPDQTELIDAYNSGILNGGIAEVAPGGVWVKNNPQVLPRCQAYGSVQRCENEYAYRFTGVRDLNTYECITFYDTSRIEPLCTTLTTTSPIATPIPTLPPTPVPTPVPTLLSIPIATPIPTLPPTPVPTPTLSPKEKLNYKVNVSITVIPIETPVKTTATISITVLPSPSTAQKLEVVYPFTINTIPISVNISDPLIESAYEFLQTAIETYVDEDRELKTLLNYGEDRQSVSLAYRYGPIDENNVQKIQLKLLQPVPDEVSVGNNVFLSREVAKSVIDKIRVRFAPPLDSTPYLRPKNLKANNNVETGKTLSNVTLNVLNLQSGSVGREDLYKNKSFEDQIFRRWYSYDFNSADLNIDFTNYNNFVFYGSAAMRLAAFREKLLSLEKIEQNRLQFLSSSAYVGTTGSSAFLFVQEKSAEYAREKENIIRAFDRYEQYLYFTPSGSDSPYTASAYYADEGYEYNSFAYWPKDITGSLYTVYSTTANNWYETQSLIAQRFDEFNENNLVNTIPTHIREHDDNAPYITFVSMVGHFFDIIKPYVDQFPNIYSRNLNPNEELSKDLINEIAESIGFKLPTLDSTYDLADNILGTESETPRRDLTAEIYKRLLHNLPFFAKAKGTKTSLDTLLKTFGITSQLITVKETGTPVTSSYVVFDEYSTGLDFDDAVESYISFPISASARNPKALQFNCTIAKTKTMTLLTGDVAWGLHVVPHPTISTLGQLRLTSGSSNTVILSSSYHEVFGDELVNVALQIDGTESSLYLTQVEGEEVIYQSIVTETSSFANLWNSTQFVYLGGAGARTIARFDGTLDELRLWKNTLSDEVILNSAFDPASSAGDTYTDASNNLLIQLSFNNVNQAYLIASSSFYNESPYKDMLVSPSLETIQASNITTNDFSRYNRTIRQEIPQVGTSAYITSKVKVSPPPIFPSTGNGLRLYRTKSILPPTQKRYQRGRNKVIIGMSPTEIVNQNIIRNFGLENINAVLGAPSTLYTTYEKSLSNLKKHYQQYYRIDVNTNRFVRIMSDLNSVLDQMMDYFIPAKATVLQGIIIEPNILEQVKIPPVRNIRLYGKDTRKTLQAVGSLSSSKPDYGATFNAQDTIDMPPTTKGTYVPYKAVMEKETVLTGNYSFNTGSVELNNIQFLVKTDKITGATDLFDGVSVQGVVADHTTLLETHEHKFVSASYNVHKTIISNYTNEIISSSYLTFNNKHENWKYSGPNRASSIDTNLFQVNKIKFNSTNNGSEGAEPYNRVYTRKLFTSEINTERLAGNTSLYIPALYDIPPSTDFRDFGVYTYFNNSNGIYYFEELKKTPTYPTDLNSTWNDGLQKFDTVTSWSYGARYNINDVVYQNVGQESINSLGNLVKSSGPGNGFYYVFKTRPAYRPTDDGTAFYSGSVPSYLPPSLDKNNWEILRFRPYIKRVPKRIVFDTYVNKNIALNNFKTTTISIDKIIDVPDRYIESYNIPAIQPNSYQMGDISVQNISLLFALQANSSNIRIRLYRTSAARNTDLARAYNVLPTGSHGLLFDNTLTSTDIAELANPIPTLIADSTPPSGLLFYTINNLDSTPKIGLTLTLFYFALEIQPKIPFGYLKKHYRFFRDNSTGTKRRNYLGCKNTQDTTIDGLPPVQVFLSEGTEITISPTQTNQEIITGGGGTLNVT